MRIIVRIWCGVIGAAVVLLAMGGFFGFALAKGLAPTEVAVTEEVGVTVEEYQNLPLFIARIKRLRQQATADTNAIRQSLGQCLENVKATRLRIEQMRERADKVLEKALAIDMLSSLNGHERVKQ